MTSKTLIYHLIQSHLLFTVCFHAEIDELSPRNRTAMRIV